MKARVRVGVMGLGRMGRVYAAYLAQRVPNAELVAVADNNAEVARGFAEEFGVARWFARNEDLLADASVDAVAVLTPTQTHKQAVLDAAAAGKAVFCEKPMAMTVQDAEEMLAAVAKAGVLFQPGFMRRFDSGYVEAKRKLDEGVIGTPVVFTSISRDPYRPSLEFCDPAMSGGLIADMGIHDFDLARMYMGEVASVHSVGTVMAYPEMKTVGDIDNAVVSLRFRSEALGSVLASRNAVFGYDIRTEIWGTKGTLQIGYHRQTPVMVMTKEGIAHDAVPYFMERFEGAYLAQIQSFVDAVEHGRPPAVSGADAVAAMKISVAATRSLHEGTTVVVES